MNSSYYDEGNRWEQQALKIDFVNVMRQEILALGFCQDATDDLVYEVSCKLQAFIYNGKLDWGDATPEESAKLRLRSASANWKRAENTISAKKYWESYFEQHPEQKPRHLVFYDGTPTTAIHEFQTKHNIGQADTSEKEGDLLGFDDRHVLDMSKDPRAKRGYDELVAMAHKIIKEHYRKKE